MLCCRNRSKSRSAIRLTAKLFYGVLTCLAFSFYSLHISAQPAIPKFEPFQPIGIPRGPQQGSRPQLQTSSALQYDPNKRQNPTVSQQSSVMGSSLQNSRQQQLKEIMQDFRQADATIGLRIIVSQALLNTAFGNYLK
jgi:hypothetical protein